MEKTLRNRFAETLRGAIRWQIIDPVNNNTLENARELIYQQIFMQQCAGAHIKEIFYPVGAAANYALLYLLFRIICENKVDSIVELGSGQSTVLIDHIRAHDSQHLCYEDDIVWHDLFAKKLSRCDYRHAELIAKSKFGIAFNGYSKIVPTDFNLLLVDGPRGTPQNSRSDAIELISENRNPDFIVVFDDADRRGERQTIDRALKELKSSGQQIAIKEFVTSKTQVVIAAGRFQHCLYYF